MANSISAEVWLDERRWDALEVVLEEQGSNIEQHLQGNGTAQNLGERGGYGGEHGGIENAFGIAGLQVFAGGFRKAQSGGNPEVRHVVLQDDKHDCRECNHPQ